jgi:O-antigen ligase
VLLHLRTVGLTGWTARVALAAPVVAASAAAVALGRRATTSEGPESLAYRLDVLRPGLEVASAYPALGLGPGTAGFLKSAQDPALTAVAGAAAVPELSFENSWLELLLGTGALGVLALAALLVLAARSAVRGGAPGIAGALASWALVAGTFNLLDGHRPAHVLLGVLLLVAAASPPGQGAVSTQARRPVAHPGAAAAMGST